LLTKWEKNSSKKKASKKQAKSHKSAAKQSKPKVKAAKKNASAKKTSVNKKQKGGENSKKRTISDVEDGKDRIIEENLVPNSSFLGS
jgi:molecular chaperone GrpE (heat shock protein)